MYIYNVTINIEEAAHEQWLVWMKEIHIPDMLALGKFSQARMSKVLVEEDMGGITYSIQYTVKDKATLDRYYKEDAEKMRQDGIKRFGNSFVAFRTELEIIGDHHSNITPATEYLFTYGTLQEEKVQKMLFNRKLEGTQDQLLGFKTSDSLVAGLYPSLTHTNKQEHSVTGQVFAISGADLFVADTYEGEAYFRKKVSLASGKSAWVYLGKQMNPQ
ncbi:DUF4286 family protein [Muriicola sp. Z0-33]|uniref:DUF4286 family protein n=1 Tax=Muriicola sp. Z0-33 TaxID=2816957 RepID=UPI0029FFC2F2|nr:DUF4286 family protein [Muriicola sp. Z0-33]MCW5517820.1 DUF4286 family protein [Muriicola sp. Z0-33]